MQRHKTLNKLRIILILLFISSFFLVTLFYVCIKNVPILYSLLDNYFYSGNSFFFPILPYINIFWFLPQEYQTIPLSIGQLLDIFIIVTIYCCIDSSFYHYVKKVLFNGDFNTFRYFDSYIFTSKEIYNTIDQNSSKIFGLKNQLKLFMEDKRKNFINRTKRKNDRKDSLFNHSRKKGDFYKIFQNIISHRKIKFKLNSHFIQFLFLYYYSLFQKYEKESLKNPDPDLKTNNLSDSIVYFIWEGS